MRCCAYCTWYWPSILILRYDIALLRLSSDASLNNYVQLGALPPSGQVLPHNNPCYITGWGRTQSESYILIRSSYTVWKQYVLYHYKGVNYTVRDGFSCCLQLEVSCLPSWSRPTCLSLTTTPAPAMDGGAALWRAPWSVAVAVVTLDARWAS